MITCDKCGKANQNHYKFCLGCGSELSLPSNVAPAAPVAPTPVATAAPPKSQPVAPRPVSPTPPAGIQKINPQGVASTGPLKPTSTRGNLPKQDQAALPQATAAQRPPATVHPIQGSTPPGKIACASCGVQNPVNFMFCGNCGGKLAVVSSPATIGLSSAAPAPQTKRWGKLSLIKPDGTVGGIHHLEDIEVIIGRGAGPLFDNDSYLSPTHTRLTLDNNKVIIEDLESLNGVFIKLTEEERLRSGDIIRIGQELIRFDLIYDPEPLEDGTEILGSPNPDYWARLSVIMGPGEDGSAFPLMGDEMVLGRERGDILFSDDGYVSGTHTKISIREDGCYLTDMGSSNGTFLRLTQPRIIETGTFILMGQQLFRLEF